MRKPHYIRAVPALLFVMLGTWHLYSWHFYSGAGDIFQQAGVLALAATMAVLAYLPWKSEKESLDSFLRALEPIRAKLVGGSCIIIGAMHFISLVRAEPVFLQMGYMVLILAYYESAGISRRFRTAYSGEMAPVTKTALNRLIVKQMGMLGMVFALSIILLYLGLMVVVGFTETWSVALLAAVMILALVFLARVRKI